MCIDKSKLLQLCEIFPQTSENIKKIALARRYRFMEEKHYYLEKIMKENYIPQEDYTVFKRGDKNHFYKNELPEDEQAE